MKQVAVSDLILNTAFEYTQTDTLDAALLVLMGDVKVKRCENELCQKEFVFPEPLSQKPRSDARFCSSVCARRATQRAYVRRKRVKRVKPRGEA